MVKYKQELPFGAVGCPRLSEGKLTELENMRTKSWGAD